MHSNIIPFAFEDALVRVHLDENNNFWFVAKDVCKILEISKYRDAINLHLDADERVSVFVDTLGGKQEMSAVSESGLYALIFRSRKKDARRLRKWVTSEVLPTLRKTGTYTVTSIGGESMPSIGPRLMLEDLPEDVRRLKPRIRENCLNYAMQASRLTGTTNADAIHTLFIDYCRAIGGLHPDKGDNSPLNRLMAEYMETNLEYRCGKRIEATRIYKHFCRWCEKTHSLTPPSQRAFGSYLSRFYVLRKSNRMTYMDVAFTEEAYA